MANRKTAKDSGTRKSKEHSTVAGETRIAGGGELHQIAGGDHPALTTNQGLALSDNQNSLKANPRGPALLEDFILREKITHFDHERIPERVVHARGTAVHGFFELTRSLQRYTTARHLADELFATEPFRGGLVALQPDAVKLIDERIAVL